MRASRPIAVFKDPGELLWRAPVPVAVFGVSPVRAGEYGIASSEDILGVATVDRGWRQHRDAGVPVLVAVPVW